MTIPLNQASQGNAPASAAPGASTTARPAGRGDLGLAAFAASGLRRATTLTMERCVGEHDGCEFVYYHDHLESDEFFSERVSWWISTSQLGQNTLIVLKP